MTPTIEELKAKMEKAREAFSAADDALDAAIFNCDDCWEAFVTAQLDYEDALEQQEKGEGK